LVPKLYRHFVFSYLRKSGEKEAERPGALKEDSELTNLYRRRKKTRKARLAWLEANGYSKAVTSIFRRNEATSEDEYDAARGGYVVKAVTGRSPSLTQFVGWVDERRSKVVQPGRGKGKTVRSRQCVLCNLFTSFPGI
ncbi:hypothetical protein PENSPDRAFT_595699, partial [Peniophora sp. CONT]